MSGWVYSYIENKTLLAKAKSVFGDDLVFNAFLVIDYSADKSIDEVASIISKAISIFEMCDAAYSDDKLFFDDCSVRIVFSNNAVVDFIGNEFSHVVRT
jgi:hypothetical protein